MNSWLFSVCCAALCAGIAQSVCRDESKSVIKILITLYTLVLVFAPLRTAELPKNFTLPASVTPEMQNAPNPQDIAAQIARRQLSEVLTDALRREGVEDATVTVLVTADENNITVKQVTVITAQTEKETMIRLIIKQLTAQDDIAVFIQNG